MGPRKGGKGGRPRKHTIEEAQATKQAQDRQRRHQLRHARVDDPDSDGLQVVITEAPIALTGPTGPTALTAAKGLIPASSPSLQEPILDNYPTHEPKDIPRHPGT